MSGTLAVLGGIGADGQFKVTVGKTIDLKFVTESGDPVERTVHLTFYRADSTGLDELAPFEYVLKIRQVEGGETQTERRRVSIADVASDRFLGQEETVAALVLAELLAQRKAAARSDREGPEPSSIAQQGSIRAIMDESGMQFGPLTLDWETMDGLLGPGAETIVADPVVETTVPDRSEIVDPSAIDFLASDGILETREEGSDSSLEASLEDLLADTISDVFESEDAIISQSRSDLLAAKSKYDAKLDSFPGDFVTNLDAGNFGAANGLVSEDANYDQLVLVYAFQQLFEGVTELLAAQDGIEDLSLAVTAFANGLAAGDVEMAERGLENASEAYVEVTRHLLEDGKGTIESIRPVLEFHDLREPFESLLADTSELAGEDLAYYESAVDRLVETTREQHERAEKAREVFHRYRE
jgi:hypothetical protein